MLHGDVRSEALGTVPTVPAAVDDVLVQSRDREDDSDAKILTCVTC
jgi:hypothetical protein